MTATATESVQLNVLARIPDSINLALKKSGVVVDGWTYALPGKDSGGNATFYRFLVAADGSVLACGVAARKPASVDKTTHADFCESAKQLLTKA